MAQSITQDQGMPSPPPPSVLSRIFDPIGERVMRVVDNLGAAMIFLLKALALIFGRKQPAAIIQQINMIGVKTVNIVDSHPRNARTFYLICD